MRMFRTILTLEQLALPLNCFNCLVFVTDVSLLLVSN